ncbi:mycocerosic acid synthase domain protein [Mycobacterium kansasii]|uniref:Mycocerosic acid synthase domain protein n=1 Tax=Mycobacterium kansasii TaxID=1768 RepID=A0A1V3WIZ2_MYCKA|nr:mycocerosic acid synthase domain protein [Mycobacterium kansasii]
MVILTAPDNGDRDEKSAVRGVECVRHLVRITRELPEIMGEAPRLHVVTRNAQTVLAADSPNLEQAGLRGLLRVVGAEHPHLHTTHIDVDEHTQAEHIARQLLSGSEEDETAWRNDEWHTARLSPAPLLPEERKTTVVNHESAGMRLQIRTPGDLQTMEFVAFDRVTPGPAKSKSPSPPPASTSPMFWSPSVDTTPRTAGCRSWEPISRAWSPPSGPTSRRTRWVITSAACHPTAAGRLSSPATRTWRHRFRRD